MVERVRLPSETVIQQQQLEEAGRAAAYSGVTERQFRTILAALGVPPESYFGKPALDCFLATHNDINGSSAGEEPPGQPTED